MRRATPLALMITMLAVSPALAQRQPSAVTPASPLLLQQRRVYHPTYWKEGATIGAAILGTTCAWVVYGLACEFSDVSSDCSAWRVLAGGAAGGVVGGIVGGLIGGAFSAPEHRRRQPGRFTLLGAGAGALWSFGLFWQFCLNGCRSEEVAFGVSITAVGAAAGWLIGH